MDEKMKVIGRKMSIRMGILMSFSLALVGTLTSGHFTPVGFVLIFIFMPMFLRQLMKEG